MSGIHHFSKNAYLACDRESEYMKGIFSANIRTTQTVLEEFYRYLAANSISQEDAIKRIRMSGGVITRNGLWNYRKGKFYTCPNTVLNIVSRFAGYRDYIELVCAVRDREKGNSV